MKKLLSLLLSFTLLIGVITEISFTASAIESTGNANIDSFINDSRWANGISWGGSQRPKLASYSSLSCCAYCADYVKYCYGNDNPRSGSVFYSVNEIRAGDVLTVGNQSDGTGHWFVCLKRSGNSLYVAEGNYASKVRIGWNYTISGNKFAQDSRSFTAGYHYLSESSTYTQKPSNVSIALEKTTFFSNEHVTYYCSGTDVSYYVLSIYNSTGNVVETVRINPGEYCTRYYDPGTYIVYCEAFNNCGNTFSNTIQFVVKPPTNPYDVVLDLEKTSFFTDEHVTYYCDGKEVYYYVLSIYDSAGNVVETVRLNPGDYCTRYYNPGTYTAYCEAFNSCGKTFSNNVKFTVKQRCSNHTWNSGTINKKTTCTTTGTKLYTCTVCGETKTETIKAKGHTTVIDKAVPSTCTTDGKTEGSHCSVCNAVIKKQNVVKATGHKPVTVKGTPATFKAAGKTDGKKCSVCGKVLTAQKTIPKLGSPSLSKVTAGKKQFKATWKSISSIDGYQIQYSTSSSFKSGNKTVTVSGYKSTSKTVTKLTAKKKYYVRIRGYKTISGKKQYSAWSKSKTVTTKK